MSTARALSGRHVHDAYRPLDVLAALGGAVDGVDGHQEAGQGLARTGRRGDQGVGALGDEGPALLLGRGGAVGEPPGEPGGDGGMEPVEPGAARRVGGRVHGEHRAHSITSV